MLSNRLYQTPADKKILLSIVCYFLYFIVSYFSSMLKKPLGNIIVFIFISIIAFFIFNYVKTFKLLTTKYKVRSPFITVLFILLLICFFAITVHPIDNIKNVLATSPLNIFNSFIIALSAGIFEEFLVRLLMFDGFAQLLKNQKYGLPLAAIYSSIIFGLLHLSNLTFQPFDVTCQQIFYATAIGLMFSFVRLKTNGVLICVLLHSLIDFQPNISGSGTIMPWLLLFGIFIPIMLVSLWCIFKLNNKLLQYPKSDAKS